MSKPNAAKTKTSSKAAKSQNAAKKNSNKGSRASSVQKQRYASRSGYEYDRDRVAEEIDAITAYYSGSQPEKQGYRRRYTCPECGKNSFDVDTKRHISGCWAPECAVPQSVGAVKLIAHFEQLAPERDLKLILQRGYEAAGIPPEIPLTDAEGTTPDATAGGGADEGSSSPSSQDSQSQGSQSSGQQSSAATSAATSKATLAEAEEDPAPAADAAGDEPQLDFNDRVYRTVMGWCKLEKHHSEYWVKRGLTPETIAAARLGSISKRRARYVVTQIQRHFSQEDLLTVPGFFINDSGNLSFTLYGEYTLIPYFDGRARISTIEGRIYAEKPPKGMGKYVSLRDSGNHVYLFPGTDPNDLVAICEGPVGAIAAAQEGVAVGSIQGFRRYHGQPRFDGDERAPPEITGADFGQRMISYIPDVDDPPQPHVMDEAPNAARVLIALQNGKPAVATLPRGSDLDEYLLAINKPARRSSLLALLKRATPTASGAETDEQDRTRQDAPSDDQDATTPRDGVAQHNTGDDDPDNLYRLFPGTGEEGEKSESKPKKDTRGKSKNKDAGSGERQELPGRQERTALTPTPAEHDFYYWTGREQGRYKQPLPSQAPVTTEELASGLYTGGVVLAALWLMITLVFLAAGTLSGSGPPGFIPSVAAETITEWASYASDPLYAAIALATAFAVAAMTSFAVISRLSTYRKDKRRMLHGEVKW